MEHCLEREIAQWKDEGSIRRPMAPRANAVATELRLAPYGGFRWRPTRDLWRRVFARV